MSAKSSLPIFGCERVMTLAGSTTVRATSSTTRDCSTSLTSTLKVSRMSAVISPWKGAGVDLRDRQYRGLERIDVAADDGLQRLRQGGCDHHRVLGTLRHRAMRAIALDDDVEEISAGHRGSRQDRDLAVVEVRRVVQAVDLVAGKFLEQAVLDHRAGAAKAFFSGLEDEVQGAVES